MDYIKIIDWLQGQIDSGHIFWVFAVVVVFLLWHIKDIPNYLDALEHGKKSRLKRLASASEYKNLDQKLVDFIENETNYEYFRYVTGFAIGKGFREAILSIQNASNHELPMHLFSRAFHYLHFENKELCIKVGRFDKLVYFMSYIIFIISIIACAGLVYLLILSFSLSMSLDNNTLFTYIVLFTFFAWITAIDIRSFRAAKKINQLLEKLKSA